MPENDLFTCIYREGKLGFTDAKTHRKRWIFRTKNMSKRLKNAAFSVNSIFVFRTVNAGFLPCLESTLSIFLTSLCRGDWLRTNLAICYKGTTI